MNDLFEIGRAFLMALGGTLAVAVVVWALVTYPLLTLVVILAVAGFIVYATLTAR